MTSKPPLHTTLRSSLPYMLRQCPLITLSCILIDNTCTHIAILPRIITRSTSECSNDRLSTPLATSPAVLKRCSKDSRHERADIHVQVINTGEQFATSAKSKPGVRNTQGGQAQVSQNQRFFHTLPATGGCLRFRQTWSRR